MSERRACELIDVARSSCRYQARPASDVELREQIAAVARNKPRYGYRRVTVELRKQGQRVNHKRVWRVCRELKLQVRWKRRKRLAKNRPAVPPAMAVNQEWAMDFVSDTLASGRRFRVLTSIDVYSRECVQLEVATSLPSQRVTRALERAAAERGMVRSFRTILVADFVTAAAAVILFFLAVGPVRGFALTLGLATLIDVLLAYFFTRPAVNLLARSKRFSEARFIGLRSALGMPA